MWLSLDPPTTSHYRQYDPIMFPSWCKKKHFSRLRLMPFIWHYCRHFCNWYKWFSFLPIMTMMCVNYSCGTRVFVYSFVHVMCLCVYVSMVCQRCMLCDNMYSHDMPKTLKSSRNTCIKSFKYVLNILVVTF